MSKILFFKDWVIPPRVFGVLRNFYFDYVHHISFEEKRILSRNSVFKDKYAGKHCFVIGNGPSLKNVDLSPLNGEITIVMNYFNENPILGTWQPVVYCAADPVSSYNVHELEMMKEVPKKIFPKDGYFLPLSVRQLFKQKCTFPKEKTFYLDMCKNFEDWIITTNEISLTDKIAKVQNTAVLGIMLGMYMGCKKIYLLGLDHNWLAYKKISLTPHFYQNRESRDMNDPTNNWKYQQNMEAVLTMFRQYEKIHEYAKKRNIEIINLTEGSFLDEFPQAKFEDILRMD